MPHTKATIRQRKSPRMISVVGGAATLSALRALPFDSFVEAIRTPAPAELLQKKPIAIGPLLKKKPIAIGTLSKKRRSGIGYLTKCYVGPNKQVEISVDEVAKVIKERIVEAERKAYWQRKGLKDCIVVLTNKLALPLGDEYEKRLERLDDVRPGETVPPPPASKQDDSALIAKLILFFKVKEGMTTEELEEKVRWFLEKIGGYTDDKDVIICIKKLVDSNQMDVFNSKKLHEILHAEGLYKKGYSVWQEQMPSTRGRK